MVLISIIKFHFGFRIRYFTLRPEREAIINRPTLEDKDTPESRKQPEQNDMTPDSRKLPGWEIHSPNKE